MSRVPKIGEDKRGARGHVAYLLRQAAAAARGELDRAFRERGVTHPQFVALVMIDAYSGASGAQVARLALLAPQTLTVILANLERAGLVRRRRSAANKRVVLYDLTQDGKATLTECRRLAARVEARMLKGLSTNDSEIVRRWLSAVAVRLTKTSESSRAACDRDAD